MNQPAENCVITSSAIEVRKAIDADFGSENTASNIAKAIASKRKIERIPFLIVSTTRKWVENLVAMQTVFYWSPKI
jgi:hypothetical protein